MSDNELPEKHRICNGCQNLKEDCICDDNCENCGSSRLKDFKYRDGYGCWDCGYTSDDKSGKMACPDCDSFVEDGSCLCGKTRTETGEDTAEDDAYGDRVRSEAEKRDTCGNGRCNGGPSPAASELEPAAYITGDGTVEGGALELHWPDEIEGRTYQSLPEPLVRPDQLFDRLMRIVEEHRHRAEDASAAGNEKERYACESVADVIYDAVMQWKLQIKETQDGSGE